MLQALYKVTGFSILVLTMLLTGCSSTAHAVMVKKPGYNHRILIAQVTPKRKYNPTREERLQAKRRHYVHELRAYNITFIHVGDDVRLILPVSRLFYRQSPRLRGQGYDALTTVAALIASYPTVVVKVTGYTDGNCSIERNLSVSRARAQNVADYLWTQDPDTRLLYAEGKAHCRLLVRSQKPWEQKLNQRVEITMHQLVDRPAQRYL